MEAAIFVGVRYGLGVVWLTLIVAELGALEERFLDQLFDGAEGPVTAAA